MKPLLILNWKMYLDYSESIQLAQDFVGAWGSEIGETFAVVICPSYPALSEVAHLLSSTRALLGVQDMFWEDVGAYTGSVGWAQLKSFGCSYVLIGHSERRALGETDEMIQKKIQTALSHHCTPVLLVGETREEYDSGAREDRLVDQLTRSLSGMVPPDTGEIVIGYEPVWSIAPSKQVVDPGEAQEVGSYLSGIVEKMYPKHFSSFRFIYGGNVTSENVQSFCLLPPFTGVLSGRATTEKESLFALLRAVASL